MKKTDPRVDLHIQKAAPFARPILRHLRKLVHEACPEAEETIKWRSPTFVYKGKMLCGMASFQEHCTFGFWHQGMEEVLGADGAKAGEAMGSLGRITSLDDLPSDRAMARYIRKAMALTDSAAPARPRPPRTASAPPEVPDDLGAGLAQNAAAAATFEKLSPGQKKEYVEWITEAKRDETRRKRLATSLEWLAEGKRRNWKYESC